MTPENVKLLIDTIGAVVIIAMIGGFAIWSVKYVLEKDRRDD
ncbi:hypothetical protein [Sagittula sp. MA-2]|jgi:hypothetical protein|nr:hypothetical protein [Sagittula sp. MA-2]WHZ36506.1 hypothetical protein QNI11_05710 [Sagittula sp. MA-2]